MDMDSDPNGTAIGKLIAKMKKAKFSALRDIARNLGAKEETLKKIYAEKNKSAEMIKQIAVLQVVVNDTYLLLRGAGLFDLETIAVDVGVPKEDIDTALDDDTDPKKILTHMIVNRAPNFDVWDYLAQAQEQAPPKKKQKKDETYAFPAAGNEPPPLNTACGQNGMQEQGEANLDSGMSDAEFTVWLSKQNNSPIKQLLHLKQQQQQLQHHQVHPELNKIVGASMFQSSKGRNAAEAATKDLLDQKLQKHERQRLHTLGVDDTDNLIHREQVQQLMSDDSDLTDKQKLRAVDLFLKQKTIDVSGSRSETLVDLEKASEADTIQGKHTSLTVLASMSPHTSPRAPFAGRMPMISIEGLKKQHRNVLFIGWFNIDKTKSSSLLRYEERLNTHMSTVSASGADSVLQELCQSHTAKSKLKKLLPIKTPAEWYEATRHFLHYCNNTTSPQLIPTQSYPTAVSFFTEFFEYMIRQGATNNIKALNVCMRAMDLCLMDWAEMYSPYDIPYKFDEIPCMKERLLDPLGDIRLAESNANTAKITAFLQSSIPSKTRNELDGRNWTPRPGTILHKALQLENAKAEHLQRKIDGNRLQVCFKCCTGICLESLDANKTHKVENGSSVSHHCIACGSSDHTLPDCPNA